MGGEGHFHILQLRPPPAITDFRPRPAVWEISRHQWGTANRKPWVMIQQYHMQSRRGFKIRETYICQALSHAHSHTLPPCLHHSPGSCDCFYCVLSPYESPHHCQHSLHTCLPFTRTLSHSRLRRCSANRHKSPTKYSPVHLQSVELLPSFCKFIDKSTAGCVEAVALVVHRHAASRQESRSGRLKQRVISCVLSWQFHHLAGEKPPG